MALAICAALLLVPCEALAVAPINDNYADSVQLNAPGSKLNRKATARDLRNTSDATVQSDVFSPPASGGVPEQIRCGTTSYGKTVWYDFYPDVAGVVQVRTSGFDGVIAVVPFDRKTAVPDFAHAQCANGSKGTTERLLAKVRKGGSYTIQVGGVNSAGGSLEFLFDFLADTDADGVLDSHDRCPTRKGSRANGCPPRLRPAITFAARGTAGGVRVVKLEVESSLKARVDVRCRDCPKLVKSGKSVSFKRLHGRDLPAGSKLEVRLTRKGAVGSYTAYRIAVGSFGKLTRCMNPGSTKPRRKCG